MATFLDTLGVLNYFSPIFAFVLVFAVVFAILVKTGVLGKQIWIAAFVAVTLAILTVLVPDIVLLINFVAPWFVVSFLFLMLLMVSYRMFGISEGAIVDYFMNDKGVNWAILAIALVIVLGGVFHVFGQRALAVTADGSYDDPSSKALFDTLFSPQILGLGLVFAIAVFTIALLGTGP